MTPLYALRWICRLMALLCVASTWMIPKREIQLLVWAAIMLLLAIDSKQE